MEKKKLTAEMIESGKGFHELGFEYVELLPYALCEECALELISQTVIVDPEDFLYRRYNSDAIEAFIMIKYFTNLDTDEWNSEDGMRSLFDFCRKSGCLYAEQVRSSGWSLVKEMVDRLYEAME